MRLAEGKPRMLPLLTEMRGVAAILVYHFHLAAYIPALLILKRAYLCVDFFFILSGFVLTHVYREWFYPHFRSRALGNFFWARFGRIYPLQFFSASLIMVLSVLIHGELPLKKFLRELFLMNFIPSWPGLNMVSWSISSECVAYLFAPFLILWTVSRKSRTIGIAFFFVSLGLYWICNRGASFNNPSVVRCLPEFTLGIFCYEICNRWQMTSRLAAWLSIGAVFSIVASIACLPVVKWGDFGCVLSFCVLIPAAINIRGSYVRLFSLCFGYLGEISYSLYLLHPLVLFGITSFAIVAVRRLGLSQLSSMLIVYLVTTLPLILLASLSYRYVELPARSFFKRGLRQSKSHPAPAELALVPPMGNPSRDPH
jgi:peptidoglycan/LPS O-acetylase OafA/YrhL